MYHFVDIFGPAFSFSPIPRIFFRKTLSQNGSQSSYWTLYRHCPMNARKIVIAINQFLPKRRPHDIPIMFYLKKRREWWCSAQSKLSRRKEAFSGINPNKGRQGRGKRSICRRNECSVAGAALGESGGEIDHPLRKAYKKPSEYVMLSGRQGILTVASVVRDVC